MIPTDENFRDEQVGDIADSANEVLYESLLVAYDEALDTPRTDHNSSAISSHNILSIGDRLGELPAEIAARLEESASCLKLLAAVRSSGMLADLCGPMTNVAFEERDDWEEELPRNVGRFNLVRELGRGGFGIVFLAVDPNLGRQVALKIPRPEVVVSRKLRERFLREAQAASLLDHPNLVSVYEVGEEPPFCFIAAAFCPGTTLRDWLRDRATPITPRQAAELVARLADGVEHAHRRGVLHRDIKPSNVMMVPLDAARHSGKPSDELHFEPKLTDFGLAKLMEQQDDHTRTGLVLGTAAYMAPEQATGQTREICMATDVYGLGTILYELLAGCCAFRGGNDFETLRHVAMSDAPPPSRYRRGLPRDLEAICLKTLEKHPADRYGTAAELAEDLRRYLRREPTIARPLSTPAKTWRWCRKQPAVASLLAAVMVSVVGAFVGISVQWLRAEDQRRLAEDKTRQVEAANEVLRETNYPNLVHRAASATLVSDLEAARQSLAEAVPPSGKRDHREFAHALLTAKLNESEALPTGHTGTIYGLAISPGGRTAATCSSDGTVRVTALVAGLRTPDPLRGHEGEINCIVFLPDGTEIVSGGDDATIRFWNAQTGAPTLSVQIPAKSSITALAVSGDSRWLAIASTDGEVRIWDRSSKQLGMLPGRPASSSDALAFSPDHRLLAVGNSEKQIEIWEMRERTLLKTLAGHSDNVNGLAFTRPATFPYLSLASCSRRPGEFGIWNCDDWSYRPYPNLPVGVQGINWCPDDRQMAVAGRDGFIRIVHWDFDQKALDSPRVLTGHEGKAWSVAVTPDGKWLLSVGDDRVIRRWSLDRSTWVENRVAIGGEPKRAVWLARDNIGLVAHSNGELEYWNPEEPSVTTFKKPLRFLNYDVNGDGQTERIGYADGKWCWQLGSGSEVMQAKFGSPGDTPIMGDWDGDGDLDPGVLHNGVPQIDRPGNHNKSPLPNSLAKAVRTTALGQSTALSSLGVNLPVVATSDGCVVGGDLVEDGKRVAHVAKYIAKGISKQCPLGHFELDAAWGTGGFVRVPSPAPSSQLMSLIWNADGSAWVATVNQFDDQGLKQFPAVVHLLPGGVIDREFGDQGIAIIDAAQDRADQPLSMRLDRQGRITVCGQAMPPGFDGHLESPLLIARLTSTGKLDEAFADRGILLTRFSEPLACAHDLVGLADGSLIVVGNVQSGAFGDGIVARFLENGVLDTKYGEHGRAIQPAHNTRTWQLLSCVIPAPGAEADSVLVAGTQREGDAWSAYVIVMRVLASGHVDLTFGDRGIARIARCDTSMNTPHLALDSQGRILVSANNPTYHGNPNSVVIARLHPDGQRDFDFGISGDGLLRLDRLSHPCELTAVLPKNNGGLIVANGRTWVGPGPIQLREIPVDGKIDPAIDVEWQRNSPVNAVLDLWPLMPEIKDGLLAELPANMPMVEDWDGDGCDEPAMISVGRYFSISAEFLDAEGTRLSKPVPGYVQGTLTRELYDHILALLTPDKLRRALETFNRSRNQPELEEAEELHDMALSADGRLLAGVQGELLWVREAGSGQLQCSVKAHDGTATWVGFTPDQKSVVTLGNDGFVRSWDPMTGQIQAEWSGDSIALTHGALDQSGKHVAIVNREQLLSVRNLVDGQLILAINERVDAVRDLDFSPDDRWLVVCGRNQVVVYDAKTGRKHSSLTDHRNDVSVATFSPDGRTLATADNGGAVRLWDGRTFENLLELDGRQVLINSLEFSADGRRLVAGGSRLASGRFMVWSVPH